MKYLILPFLVFGIFQISCTAQKTPNENYAKTKAEKFVSISELKKQKITSGIYETEGFIGKIYTCPKCPPNAQCKPCMRDNIVLSEENKTIETYDLSDKEVIVFTDQTESFKIGKKYFFKIRITDKKTTSEPINDIELLAFKKTEN